MRAAQYDKGNDVRGNVFMLHLPRTYAVRLVVFYSWSAHCCYTHKNEPTMKNILSALLLFFAISHNAFADFSEMEIKSGLSGDYSLAVLVHDQREYVLKGDYPEKVIGAYLKGMFRVRSNIDTYFSTPLADEMAEGLRKSFVKDKWLAVASIATTKKDTAEDLASLIKTAKLHRNLVVTVKEIWVESYKNSSVNYDLNIAVYDQNAKLLAITDERGSHDSKEWGYSAAAEIFRLTMSSVLKKPDFIAALAK